MQAATSYHVLHWQFKDLDDLVCPDSDSYILIWQDQIPLGHIWWHKQPEQPLKRRIADAIAPAVNFYLNRNNQKNTASGSSLADVSSKELSRWISPSLHARPDTFSTSIVICTRNRPQHLQKCLASLIKIITPDAEILVVDNDPADQQTKDVVAAFTGVRYILEKRKGLDIARNTGARFAQNNIIAYVDDDVIIPENWLKNLSACFSDPLTMAVTGLVLPVSLSTEAQVIFERDWGFNKGYLPKTFDRRYFKEHTGTGAPVWDIGAGANMAFRREAFLYAGWFDERLDVGAAGCSGDSEMWFRVLAEGWNCSYFPQLYVYHQHRSSMEALKEQLFHYMKGHVCALLVQHEKYPFTGNFKRLHSQMPKYYAKRMAKAILKRDKKRFPFLLTEIRGCLAGNNFYYKNKYHLQTSINCLPASLFKYRDAGPSCLVSVVIPCYNYGRFLAEAIQSVWNQTHQNCEVIVIDDGSDDSTKQVCDSFAKVKYIRAERVGLPAARNIGVQQATGDYVVFLDADDFLYQYSLEINLYFFNYYKDVVMVSGGHQQVDQDGKSLPTTANQVYLNNNYTSLLQGNYIAMEAAVMYRRNLFPYYSFDTSLQTCEDYDLNLRIARDLPVYGHQKVLAAYRQHGTNMSADKDKMLRNALAVLEKHNTRLLNAAEQEAYALGIKNWTEFYTSGKGT